MICGMKLDVLYVSTETLHECAPPLDDSGPSRKVVEDLINDMVSETVKEVLTIDKIPQRASCQIEVGEGWPKDFVLCV
jgi:hypothetical protein